MNPEQVTEFADELFEMYDENDFKKSSTICYNLEILSIDNVYCNVCLKIYKTIIALQINFTLTNDKIMFYDLLLNKMDKKEKLELCDMIETIHKLYETLPKIKLNKLKNELTTKKTTADISSMLCHSNIQTKFDKCSICLDTTIGKTKCKHSLCLLCKSKLEYDYQNKEDEEDEEDEDEQIIPCPICRKNIL